MAIFFAMPGNERLGADLARLAAGTLGSIEVRSFPDGETYVRVLTDVKQRDVFIVCTLARPDGQFLALSFAAAALRDLGASRVQLIAPYLAYMRQDRIFHEGEALTSRLFAQLVQQHFDGLITIDPHLHRHVSIDEVYDIPSLSAHVGPLFAAWIAGNVRDPLVIGPDEESGQWVEAIAREVGAPWSVMHKERRGDRDVAMRAPDLDRYRDCQPVIIDDILSSGTSLRRAIGLVCRQGLSLPYCLIVHALCSARTARSIKQRSAGLLTTNSVPNPDALFDVSSMIADIVQSAPPFRGSSNGVIRRAPRNF